MVTFSIDSEEVLEQLREAESDRWILSNLDTGEIREYAQDYLDMVDDDANDIDNYDEDELIRELSHRFKTQSQVQSILSMLDINDIANFVENN